MVQNRCLRLITGCHLASSVDHLHQETQILPVEKHLHLLSSQYLARALYPSHPSHHLVVDPARVARKMKETLRSKCWDAVSPFLQNDVIQPSQVVSDTVNSFGPNRVLNALPPLIHYRESSVPRRTRSILSQLRSGHCSRLNNYRHRVGRSDTDLCPDCNQSVYTSSHLFQISNVLHSPPH